MHSFAIRLHRLFRREPSHEDLAFCWWFLKRGFRVWKRRLLDRQWSPKTVERTLSRQTQLCRRTLEVWDTDTFQKWDTGLGPGGDPGIMFDCPGVPLADVLEEPQEN